MVMALKKKPVTGMKDMLPKEMEIRDYVIQLIKDTYKTYGFTSMETPCVEHIENLCSKQGGDNEKLIFKILKRGEKLKIDEAKEENDLVDGGLRYDLTVPLARYYANHSNELPAPFKALQIGNVWRADRPQKGRFRQFMQCDIDILGEPGNLAEIELILATTAMLGKLNFHNFTVCINDRNILKAMAAYSGFKEEDYDEVFIILDKMDKIGAEGVAAELQEMGYTKENVETYLQLFDEVAPNVEGIRYLKEKLGDVLSDQTADGMEMIISSVEAAKECEFNIKFDPTLVRGQSYYTGTIFEVTMDDFGGSVAGGGRYDKIIGKFTGQDTPACGFSIGFERIVMLLLENGYEVPKKGSKKAYLLEKNMPKEGLLKVLSLAKADREAGRQVLIVNMKKNKKFQKEQLTADGYEEIIDCYADSVENI
ncbi:histidine--tRNA ligase [Lachnospiraceae bacterium HCP28S3_F9]